MSAITTANSTSGTTDTLSLSTNCVYSFASANAADGTNGDSALPKITSPIVINGNGATIERASGASTDFRLMHISSTGNLTLNNATIRNGQTTGSGGGIYNENGVLTVTASTFSNNSAIAGGGLANWDTGVGTITDSVFSNNTATDSGGGVYSGGIHESGQLTIKGSTFTGNDAKYGGGLINRDTLTIIDSIISENTATNLGGGVDNGGPLTIINSTISGNTAGGGGGFNNGLGGSMTIINTFITGNKANAFGAVVNAGEPVNLINTTIAGNSESSGGTIDSTGSTTTLTNSIVRGNSSGLSGSPTVTYSIIEGGYTGRGNLDVDPQFVSPVDYSLAPTSSGDYHLLSNSPAIDKGNAAALPADTTDLDGDSNTAETLAYDIDSAARIVGTTVDIGADEMDYCAWRAFPYTAVDAASLVIAIKCANNNATTDTINLPLHQRIPPTMTAPCRGSPPISLSMATMP